MDDVKEALEEKPVTPKKKKNKRKDSDDQIETDDITDISKKKKKHKKKEKLEHEEHNKHTIKHDKRKSDVTDQEIYSPSKRHKQVENDDVSYSKLKNKKEKHRSLTKRKHEDSINGLTLEENQNGSDLDEAENDLSKLHLSMLEKTKSPEPDEEELNKSEDLQQSHKEIGGFTVIGDVKERKSAQVTDIMLQLKICVLRMDICFHNLNILGQTSSS